MRSAVVGPMTISPPCADPAKRAATFVVEPVAVKVHRCDAPTPSLVAPTSASPVLMLRVARDVEEEHGHLDALLLQLGRVGILLQELLDGVGHELRELALQLLEQLEARARLLEVVERRLELRVLGAELRVRLRQPRGHLVE